ncbi:helix-turn-helix domain-containing protein [Bacillus sp. FSL K6-1109]|uniref:Helix-turn-helix domain-containing protein n=2 Tax=Bacillaceae TaxID=186817 RepID=A0AB37GSS7_BACLI|nr:helix-turn-helix domain-containing protein [Bacillus licheniformis]AMR09917.1 AraC family transcriptional regulator [Bacillus licheniformis]ARC62480.1 HTH-type transcriptional regulator YesS [Bacillus licheniformis]AVI49108.1 HTH-type transcriptional regulator YesS [Bacillus licheniformis]AYC50988.1 AraC family transcriptional regulator [Bacillus licheniformis]KAA0815414.1 helix-turn-helix domain-containing protein [Bacillus licheniformis]
MKKLHQRYVSRRKGSFFKKSFVMILLIACIPGLLTGAGVYLFSAAKIEKELQHLHENQVKRQISQIDDKLEGLEIMLSQLAYDPRLMNGLADADLQTDFQTTYKLSKSLFLLQDQNPLIHKVELFIQGKEPILLNPEYSGLTDRKILKAYHSLLEGGQNVYWKDMSGASSGMALVHKIPGGILEPFGALILTLDERELGRLLESLSPYSKGTALLFHHNQKPVSWSNRGKTNFESALKERLEKQKNPQGSFVMDWSGGAYSVSYGRMDRLNQEWTYVSASPMSAITAPVLFLSKLIASVSIAGIVLAFILAWYASHKIYSPVARLIKLCSGEGKAAYFPDEFHWLEKRWEDLSEESGRLKKELPHAANVFFQRLLSGYFADESERNLRDRLKRWGWEAKDNVFTIIDVQLTGLYEGNGSFTKKDESLAGFLLGNITRELAGRTFNHIYMTDVRSLSLAVLLASGRNTAFKEEIAQFVRELTDVIYSISKLHVTVTVSNTADKLKDIPGIYEEVKEGRHYRQFENASQVIDLSRREDMPPAESYYPFALEKEVVRALRLEERDEVERRIRLFIRELSEKGKTEIRIQPGMMQLFAKIQEEIFHSGLHPNELFRRKNLLQELSELREPERAVGWMMERCISPYLKEMEGRKNRQQKRLVEQVLEMIHQDYMNDISLESCADRAGTNSYTLSKAFKQVTGINFIDYVTRLRIEKAKELLLETNKKIHDVSEEVGYRHSYFNRIFKKQVGIPPSRYRQIHQESS